MRAAEKRQQIWDAVRGRDEFTTADIRAALPGLTKDFVNRYLRALRQTGYLRYRPGPGRVLVLRRNSGPLAPQIATDGTATDANTGGSHPPRPTREPTTARGRMWRAMRMLRSFETRQLCAVSEPTSLSNVQAMVLALERTGYLRALGHKPGGAASGRYILIRDTGTKPPQLRADGSVYDANEDRFYEPRAEATGKGAGHGRRKVA